MAKKVLKSALKPPKLVPKPSQIPGISGEKNREKGKNQEKVWGKKSGENHRHSLSWGFVLLREYGPENMSSMVFNFFFIILMQFSILKIHHGQDTRDWRKDLLRILYFWDFFSIFSDPPFFFFFFFFHYSHFNFLIALHSTRKMPLKVICF